MDPNESAGSALITNTMLVNAAKFIENPSRDIFHENISIGGLFNFSNMIEAVILRNCVYTLEGDIIPNSHGKFLDLISALYEKNILFINRIPLIPEDIESEIDSLIGINAFKKMNNNYLLIPELFPEMYLGDSTEKFRHHYPDSDYFWTTFSIDDKFGEMMLKAKSSFQFFRNGFREYTHESGGRHRGAYILRTFIYNRSAYNERISFIPDYPRSTLLYSLNEQVYNSVVTEAYQKFAKLLECESEEFLKDTRPIGLPLPPFTSILLDRCETKDDIIPELIEMRNEFNELRTNLTMLEKNRLECININERNKSRKQVEDIFKAISEKYNKTNYTIFKNLISFGADTIAPVYDPLNPKSYNSNLLDKSSDLIKNWWLRRPLTQFFDIANDFRSIKEYNKLCQKIFKIDIKYDDITDYKKTQEELYKTYMK